MKKILCALLAIAALASLAFNVVLLRKAEDSATTLTYMEPDRQYRDGNVKTLRTLRTLVDHPAAYQNRNEAGARLKALMPAAAIRQAGDTLWVNDVGLIYADGIFSRTQILDSVAANAAVPVEAE